MTPEHRQAQRFLALDPARSVTVEACAGSGKTWLLASRLLRLLLAGARPGEILAITYTRKAAREIEARLRGLLSELATAPEAQVLKMLTDRGLPAAEAQALLPKARGLFEAVLHAEPAITITTFHGWFARLLGGAPLDSGLAGRSLDAAASSLLDEAWVLLAADCGRSPDSPLAEALLWLYGEQGAFTTRKLVGGFVERRAEWRVWQEQCGGSEGVARWLDAEFGVGGDPLGDLFMPARLDELEEFARLLGQNTATDQAAGNALAQAVVDVRKAAEGNEAGSDPSFPRRRESSDFGCDAGDTPLGSRLRGNDEAFGRVRVAFLTATNSPRARKPSAAQAKRLGASGEERYLALHSEWSARVIATLGALQDQRNAELNRRALLVGEALLARFDELKRQRRAMDFADLEAEIDKLLASEGGAAYLQARLDARYKHILLDEFQDTNPLQWRILRGWLDGYSGAGAARPSVFLVGDPKQSIYRFRRAEPKLFVAASEYFKRDFGAERIGNAHTFRNAGGIVALVNAVFGAEPLFAGFEAQTTEHPALASCIELLPLIAGQAVEADVVEGLRNPLETSRVEAEDLRRSLEAALLAQRIGAMVGSNGEAWLVRGKDGRERAARYSDVLVLTRRKTQLAAYEAALREAGIPFVSPGRGGLLETLEAQDLLATLRWLADPADNLALAHLLRAPAFAFSDEDLLAISAEPGVWWSVLRQMAGELQPLPAGGSGLHTRSATEAQDDVLRIPSFAPCQGRSKPSGANVFPPDKGGEGGYDDAFNECPTQSAADVQRAVRLLSGWLNDAAHLPAHDLIDRIFHQADWFARCRAVLPAALWPGVHANLEALLELALNVDAGRYPSLTRFVDELRRLSVSDDEAPDEGLVVSAGEGQGRVRIMTIHGAKGLEAPIVWLIDANSPPRNPDGYGVAMDWPADALAPQHFSLLGKISEAGPSRAAILEREAAAAEREELNLLYVAITRAEQVLIVSGIEPAKTMNAATPYKRLALAMGALQASAGCIGEMPRGAVVSSLPALEAKLGAALQPVPAVGSLRRSVSEPQVESTAGMEFGTAMHAWLEAATANLPLPSVAPEVEQAARRLLGRPALRRFFDPALHRRAANETAFVGADGKLGRIDRWVECEDAIWVLDYKSGKPSEEVLMADYRAQVAGYREVLQAIFPDRPVKALLVFAEGGEISVT